MGTAPDCHAYWGFFFSHPIETSQLPPQSVGGGTSVCSQYCAWLNSHAARSLFHLHILGLRNEKDLKGPSRDSVGGRGEDDSETGGLETNSVISLQFGISSSETSAVEQSLEKEHSNWPWDWRSGCIGMHLVNHSGLAKVTPLSGTASVAGVPKSSDLWWGGWIGVHTAIWCPATCRRHIVAFLSLYLKSKTRKREIRHSDRQEGTKITRDQIFRNCMWVVLPWPEGLLMARVILHSLSSYGKSLNTFIHSRVCIVKHCSLGSDWPLICIKEIQIINKQIKFTPSCWAFRNT